MDFYNENRRGCENNFVGPYHQDHGPYPYVTDIELVTEQNQNYRTALWTGSNLQLTLMCIPVYGEIGMEVHPISDQFLHIVQGNGVAMMGKQKDQMEFQQCVSPGDVVFIPTGTWHNVVNTGCCPLKLYSIYAPPIHPHGAVQRTKDSNNRIGD